MKRAVPIILSIIVLVPFLFIMGCENVPDIAPMTATDVQSKITNALSAESVATYDWYKSLKTDVNNKSNTSDVSALSQNVANLSTTEKTDISAITTRIDNLAKSSGGSTDLTNYYTKAQVQSAINTEVDKVKSDLQSQINALKNGGSNNGSNPNPNPNGSVTVATDPASFFIYSNTPAQSVFFQVNIQNNYSTGRWVRINLEFNCNSIVTIGSGNFTISNSSGLSGTPITYVFAPALPANNINYIQAIATGGGTNGTTGEIYVPANKVGTISFQITITTSIFAQWTVRVTETDRGA